MKDFSFLREYSLEEIENLEADFPCGRPTIGYFANESDGDRYVYEILPSGEEVYVTHISQHVRFRFNLNSGQLFLIKNNEGDTLSCFLIEDQLCQAVFTNSLPTEDEETL